MQPTRLTRIWHLPSSESWYGREVEIDNEFPFVALPQALLVQGSFGIGNGAVVHDAAASRGRRRRVRRPAAVPAGRVLTTVVSASGRGGAPEASGGRCVATLANVTAVRLAGC